MAQGAGKKKEERESVTLEHCDVDLVKGDDVVMRQASAHSVETGELTVRQGAALRIQADVVEMTQGGALLVNCGKAELEASTAGVVISGGNVEMDQSASRLILARGDVKMDQSGVLVAVGQTVKVEKSSCFMVVAGRIEGNLETKFGPRESLILGAAAGFAAGLTLALFRLLAPGDR